MLKESLEFSSDLSLKITDLNLIWEQFKYNRQHNICVRSVNIQEEFNNSIKKHLTYYRNISAQSSSELPIVDKKIMTSKQEEFISDDDTYDVVWHNTTSGSSGKPLDIYRCTLSYLEKLYLLIPKILYTYGIDSIGSKKTFASLFITDNPLSESCFFSDPFMGSKGFSRLVISPEKLSSIQNFDDIANEIIKINSLSITSKPAILVILSKYSLAGSNILKNKFKYVISSGALLSHSDRVIIEEAFDCKVINAYCTEEAGYIGSESIYSNDFLVDPTGVFIESDNNGCLLVTTLKNKVMPLLRYNIQDKVEICITPYEEQQRIKNLLGRKPVIFKLSNGGMFSPSYFMHIFKRFKKLNEYQIEQINLSEFIIRVDVKEKTTDIEFKRIIEYICTSIPGNNKYIVEKHNFLNLGKHQRFKVTI